MTWHTFLALDPGSVHCGVARFKNGKCQWAREYDPQGLFTLLEHTTVQGVISESFRLYPNKAAAQFWSQLKTVEVIGVIKYICKMRGIPVIEQPASIKIPIAAQLAARHYKYKSHGHGGHAKDSEYHGMYYLARNKK